MPRPLLLGLVCAALLAGASPAPAPAAVLACGDSIVVDTVLENNLLDCAGDGIVIAADGITLDLAGRVVDGTGGVATAGVRLNGRSGVTVTGTGVVREFGTGVAISGGQLNRVTSLVVHGIVVGVEATNSSDNVIDRNTLNAHGLGVTLGGPAATGNTVRGNEIYGSMNGIRVIGANGNTIQDNECHDNTDGVSLVAGDGNTVRGNQLSRNSTGLRIGGDFGVTSDANQVRGNVLTSNVRGCGSSTRSAETAPTTCGTIVSPATTSASTSRVRAT